MKPKLSDSVLNKVWEQKLIQMANQIKTQVDINIKSKIFFEMRHLVESQLTDQVRSQIRQAAEEKIK